MITRRRLLAASLVALAALSGCSRIDRGEDAAGARDQGAAAELRLGYFPNVTHASALIGVDKGFFAEELGGTKLTTQTFNAGPDAVNALLGGSLDATFIGSGPAINAYAKSGGEAVRLVAGATSGGAQLVVKPEITAPADLKGKVVTTPQLGNTQDVALKKWLADQQLTAGEGADAVTVTNIENSQSLDLFRRGDVHGAWAPEPWSSRLVVDAGAKVLVDEKSLWEGGRFPTTVLLVRTEFLRQHPQTVEALLRGHVAAIDYAGTNAEEAKRVVNTALEKLTGKALGAAVLDRAFGNIELTADPQAASFPRLAQDAVTAGVSGKAADVAGLADFTLLNKVLAAAGKPAVDTAGLDKK
ncbi:ABC transporter substrate-binding protein [Saccharothrix coeruleofusca]|uniref:Sulfonate ABC transporter substrate-binding protein n=1 Tax=Saccharothrix coeruleofusca TaxID=33919 RepID=A0A918AIP5_9PSEU|nr:ABC transporter substrate-binding protein [Saccharothrix coeruleofusca]MBP2334251.1 NitT/TauT family transport system substrate-binding protein [Saccharothrix coeruleofusca]GGP42355.1 sulfonate ABC transporter substrate-binding protein [Saccharothrix coeruleofusca]